MSRSFDWIRREESKREDGVACFSWRNWRQGVARERFKRLARDSLRPASTGGEGARDDATVATPSTLASRRDASRHLVAGDRRAKLPWYRWELVAALPLSPTGRGICGFISGDCANPRRLTNHRFQMFLKFTAAGANVYKTTNDIRLSTFVYPSFLWSQHFFFTANKRIRFIFYINLHL